jgi:hypothetical protein
MGMADFFLTSWVIFLQCYSQFFVRLPAIFLAHANFHGSIEFWAEHFGSMGAM